MQHIEKNEILFVINPNAGKRNIKSVLKNIHRIDSDIKYVITSDLNNLEDTINKEFNTHKVFVAVGGDGTVNALIKYLIDHKDKSLAILPFGSGNGFSNELGFKHDIEYLIRQIVKGDTLDVDILEINNNYFINLAGIGLDAEIAHKFQTSKERGFTTYIFSTIKTYFTYKPFKATITGKGINMDGEYLMISIANTRQFGNNAYISPTSKAYDGKFEVVALKPIHLFQALPFVCRLFRGTLSDSKYIHYFTFDDSVFIKTNFNKFHIDGDPLFSDGNYDISINKKALRIIKM
jgi:YegS/Rv2252/BmrU family lipid kinase